MSQACRFTLLSNENKKTLNLKSFEATCSPSGAPDIPVKKKAMQSTQTIKVFSNRFILIYGKYIGKQSSWVIGEFTRVLYSKSLVKYP